MTLSPCDRNADRSQRCEPFPLEVGRTVEVRRIFEVQHIVEPALTVEV